VTSGWVTDDDLRNAYLGFAAEIDGWVEPEAHGIVEVAADGTRTVATANQRNHKLPAVVLARVLGRSAGTETWEVSLEQLAEGIEILSPAEAAVHMEHPNLQTWKRLLAEEPYRLEAVFIDDLDDEPSSEADRLLRARLGFL
jgi:hypothetical protein